VTIRPLRADDAEAAGAIERRASERFRDVGLPGVADDDPFTADEIAEYAAAGRGWVAVDGHGGAVGYVVVDVVDGNAHVEQVSVDPDHQGRGIGGALVERVRDWAVDNGMRAITLTTFRDVPWNRPLYEHLGFAVVDGDDIGPELDALRRAEATHGLDPDIRVCMRLDLLSDPGMRTTFTP
jgi:GNAT superfamily N-acetyltransferase